MVKSYQRKKEAIVTKDEVIKARISDRINQCRDGYYVTSTDFLDSHEQSMAMGEARSAGGVRVLMYGGYDDAERRMMICIPADLELSDRQWQCPHCGCRIEDRDLNAALNLYHYPEMKWDRPRTPVQGRSSESTADQAPPAVADHNGELDDHTAGVSLLCAEEEPVSGRGLTEAARISKNGEEDSIH